MSHAASLVLPTRRRGSSSGTLEREEVEPCEELADSVDTLLRGARPRRAATLSVFGVDDVL